jgi:23S rRNA pseudouridine2605 synthase
VPKIYHAKIEGRLETDRLELLRSGVTLDDGEKTAPADVQVVRKDDKHTFIEVTITEGKNRQIHRMLEAVDRTVLRLTRTGFAGLPITGLRPGQMRTLTNPELSDLKQKYLNPSKKPQPGVREDRASKYQSPSKKPQPGVREDRASKYQHPSKKPQPGVREDRASKYQHPSKKPQPGVREDRASKRDQHGKRNARDRRDVTTTGAPLRRKKQAKSVKRKRV